MTESDRHAAFFADLQIAQGTWEGHLLTQRRWRERIDAALYQTGLAIVRGDLPLDAIDSDIAGMIDRLQFLRADLAQLRAARERYEAAPRSDVVRKRP